jgi:hypothetical protein
MTLRQRLSGLFELSGISAEASSESLVVRHKISFFCWMPVVNDVYTDIIFTKN